jgi:uncharacterized membrane protein YphA (DoxX/SURF4 family)
MRALLEPKASLAALILRLGLAAIFIVHGYFKLYVRDPLIADVSIESQKALGAGEFACGLLLLFGLLSRVAAAVLIVFQVAAIVMISGKYAMVLVVTKSGADYRHVGPEYNFVLIAMCLAVIALGSGVVSLDNLLARRLRGSSAPAPAPSTSGVA